MGFGDKAKQTLRASERIHFYSAGLLEKRRASLEGFGLNASIRRRKLVGQRDGGICQLCGIDCLALSEAMAYIAAHIESHAWWPLKLDEVKRAIGVQVKHWPRKMWEVDHIMPTSVGGSDKPENLRTLCYGCHCQETTKLKRWVAAHSDRRRGIRPTKDRYQPTLGVSR